MERATCKNPKEVNLPISVAIVPTRPMLAGFNLTTFPLLQLTPFCPQRPVVALVCQPRDPLLVKPLQKDKSAAWSTVFVCAVTKQR